MDDTMVSNESPLFGRSRKIRRTSDVGNNTMPAQYGMNNDINNGYSRPKSPIMPEIMSIKSQRNSTDRSIFRMRSRKDKHSGDNGDSDGQAHSYSDSIKQSKFNSNEPALLSLPLVKSDSMQQDSHSNISQNHSRNSLHEPIAESSPNSRQRSSDIDTPTDVEAHMAATDSTLKNRPSIVNAEANSSGLFSSLVSAAHNAASHIVSSSRQPEEFKSHPPAEHSEAEGTSFMQHLDSLLFSQPKRASREASAESPTKSGGDEDDDCASQISKPQSLAHDVVFQPIRKNALSTLGKGELTLEALGFTDASLHSERNSINRGSMNQVPQISIDAPADSKLNQSNSINRSRQLTESNGATTITNGNGAAITKVVSGPSAFASDSIRGLGDDSNNKGRSSSPVSTFRRSLSPGNLAKMAKSTSAVPTQDTFTNGSAKKLSHRRSVSSGTENQSGINQTASIVSAETNNSTTPPYVPPISPAESLAELKDVNYASSKRNAEFHSMFKKIPKNERLLEDYSCALQKDILIQGRMYITERHICFNSNILGWVTSIIIPLQEIVQLEKKSIAGLFPNSIVIQTLHQKYVFASFLARDVTFDLITNIWNKLVRGPNGNIDMQVDLDDDFSGSDMGSDLDESDDYDSNDEFDTDFDGTSSDGEDEDVLTKHSPTEPEHKEVSGETKIRQGNIEAPLTKVFQMLFGDDTSNYKKIIEAQKNKDISSIPKFQKNGDDVAKREFTYIKPLNGPVGPKETSCQVVETLDFKNFDSYVLVTQNTKTPDVPSGNSFSVQTQIYLSWGGNNSTDVTVYTSIQWTGKSWIKSAIEKGTIDGQKESIGILIDELQKMLSSSEGDDLSDSSDSNNVSSLPTVGPATHEPTDNEYKKTNGETQIADEVLHAPLGTIYSLLFGDDSTYFKSILETQKNFDLTPIPNFEKDGDLKKRQYSYTKPLNGPIGPKQTRCNITETIEHFDVNKYILVSQVTASPDVPSGNAFTVVTNFYLSWAANNSTRLLVITSINWTGKSWIKGPIEKGTIEGQNESIAVLIHEIETILNKASSGKKGKKKTKSKSRSNTIKEPIKTPSQEMEAKNPLGMIGNLQIPYAFGGLIIVSILLWFIVRFFMVSNNSSSYTSIDHVQKVIIEGREYMIIPSVEQSFKDDLLKEQSEYEIWKWINERTKSDKIDGGEKNHENQDLNEMVKLAEQHLQVLKSQIAQDEEESSTSSSSSLTT